MPYCPADAFKERFGTDEHDQLLASGTDRTYAAAAADADALVDGYIGVRYKLPLAVVPAFIVAIAADLTRYELYEEAPTKEVIERRKLAMDMLRDIRVGVLVLAGADPASIAPTIAVESAPTVYTPDVMSSFVGSL